MNPILTLSKSEKIKCSKVTLLGDAVGKEPLKFNDVIILLKFESVKLSVKISE